MTTPSKPALRAAVAIINSTVNPALRHDAINCNAENLARIIDTEAALPELIEVLALSLDAIDVLMGQLAKDSPELLPKDISAEPWNTILSARALLAIERRII